MKGKLKFKVNQIRKQLANLLFIQLKIDVSTLKEKNALLFVQSH